MAITNFIPEIWSAQLLTSLKKSLVFAGPGVVNSNYEGEIQQSGDTVRIVSISRPTVATYTKNSTTITPETLTDAQRSLLIDQSKYFAFEVDDIDTVSYTHLRAHETVLDLVCRLLLDKKKNNTRYKYQ